MKTSVLIPTTGDIATVREHAALADQLGYDSVNCSHIAARDSFTTLAGLAHLAPSVTLATAVVVARYSSLAAIWAISGSAARIEFRPCSRADLIHGRS